MNESVNKPLDAALESFKINSRAVRDLLEFDQFLLDVAIKQLRTLETRTRETWTHTLKLAGNEQSKNKKEPLLNPALSVERTITFLKNIRDHGSLKPHYEVMINQALVLLVSYFGSAVRDLVRYATIEAVRRGASRELLKFEVRTRIEELRDLDRPIQDFLGDHFVESAEVSFQDMKSINRTLKTYFDVDLERDEVVNDIIAGQACRHAIVHSGLTCDSRMVSQLSGAKPRSVKPSVQLGERIQFNPTEVGQVQAAMLTFLTRASAAWKNARIRG
jgi:hypothetical protein